MNAISRRFWSKVVEAGPDECWFWSREKKPNGYGVFRPHGTTKKVYAHRFAYEDIWGEGTASGLDVDHMCHNESDCPGGHDCPHRACCNPAHLRAVSRSVNLSAGRGGDLATHCKNGHELTPDNLYVSKGTRSCKTCTKARQRAYHDRKRDGVMAPYPGYRGDMEYPVGVTP